MLLLLLIAALAGMAGAAFGEDVIEEILDIPDVIDRTADPAAVGEFSFRKDAKLLEIWFPNILNADEAILTYDGKTWLIDCGDERMGSRGAALLKLLGITEIEKLINTHPHHDHLNGLRETVKAAKVDELLFCFTPENIHHYNSLKNYKEAVAFAGKKEIAVSSYEEGSVFTMGDGTVKLICYANTAESLDVNNRSAQILVRYGKRTILFMADMEKPGQEAMLERVKAETFKADILKYPHHGKSEMYEAFMEAVDPKIAVITNQRVENWKGIKYLKKRQVPYVYTAVYRNVKNNVKKPLYLHLVTDGEHWVAERVFQEDVK